MIAPDKTHIQIETPQRKTTSLIYPLPICVWTDGSVRTNFGPGGTGVLFYATYARTQHHFPSPTVRFYPALPQKSQSSSCPWMVPPTSLHLPIHLPECLYKLPVLPLPPELCLKPPYLECCVNNLVLYCCLSNLAQLSLHWIPGQSDM